MPLPMGDQRALDAISRIERALARVEAAAARAQAAQRSDATAGSQELERLRGAHSALRSRVEGAIGQIDRLLDTGAQG
jgi:uncharacterized membrane protein